MLEMSRNTIFTVPKICMWPHIPVVLTQIITHTCAHLDLGLEMKQFMDQTKIGPASTWRKREAKNGP